MRVPSLFRWISLSLLFTITACSQEDKPVLGPYMAVGVDPNTGASIETNKDDYVPGEIVHLVMKGWATNEDVRLIMTEDPDTHGDVDTTVTVDANGEWSGHFYDVQEHDAGVTFTLTATGQTSGSSATAVFTDSRFITLVELQNPATSAWVTSPGAISVASGTSINARVTVTTTSTGGGGEAWQSTSWEILTSPGGVLRANGCDNSIDVTTVVVGSQHVFAMADTAPAGTYTVRFMAWRTADCGNNASSSVSWATLTNTAPAGSITIVKDAEPNDAQDFAFSTTGAGLSAFTLDDDGDNTFSTTKAFTGLSVGVARTITEPGETGWTLTNIACSGATSSTVQIGADSDFDTGDNAVSITLAAGENVSCTFTNTKQGSITIVKDATPNDAQNFSFTASGTGMTSPFELDDDGEVAVLSNQKIYSALLPDGVRTVTEDGETGWTVTDIVCTGATTSTVLIGGDADFDDGDKAVSITLAAGENVTCTFTNTKQGSITIVKDANPNHTQNFGFTSTGAGMTSPFELDDDGEVALLSNQRVFSGLLPGARTVTEDGEAGWTVTDIVCTGATSSTVLIGADSDFDDGDKAASITLAAGENVSCTFTNTKHGSITIVKDANPNHTQNFGFTSTGVGMTSPFQLDDDGEVSVLSNQRIFAGLLPDGARTVTEDGETGWTVTDIVCTGATTSTVLIGVDSDFDEGDKAASITLTAGEEVTCTFTNTKTGSITIVKDALPDHPQNFDFTATGTGMSSPFQLDDDGELTILSNERLFTGLLPSGARTITELGETGWALTDIQCTGATTSTVLIGADADFDDGDNTVSITLGAGEDVTCTFTNTNLPPELAAINNIVDHPEETQATFTAVATDIDPVTYTIEACVAGTYPTGAAIGASSGIFTWTPGEAEGAADYCVKVVATAIGGTDDQEVAIGVAEVNKPPVLTVPADFSIKWGVALSGVNASATDPDLAAPPPGTALNSLTMSLTTFPAGMTINTTSGTTGLSRAISWTPAITDVGPNTVTVKVEDNGSPVKDDSESFTITVLAHTTTLTYDGATSGQYSDVSQLCATLTDDDVSGAAIPGKTITFYWDAGNVGTGTTNASGKACTDLTSNVYTVGDPNGDHTVKAVFAAGGGYLGDDTGNITFDVDAEDAAVNPDAANQNAYQVSAPGGTATFTLKFAAMEKYGPEPDPNDKARPGDITKAALTVTLTPIGGGPISSSCSVSGSGTTYGSTENYSCLFTSVPVETYELKAELDGTYYIGSESDVITVVDPSLGFVTGGGKYLMDGDRVNIGFVGKIVQNKKSSVVKGSLLVIRHKSNGDVARIKSNVFDGLAITNTATEKSATFSGKANYSVNGVTDPTNYAFTAYVLDGGTSGAGVDKFSLYHAKGNATAGYEVRTSPTFAALKDASSVKTLTGGNIQVPQPSGPKP